jgi:hypothetical protein
MTSQGFARAYLWTQVGNARARRFYEREGWADDGGRRFHDAWQTQMARYVTRF